MDSRFSLPNIMTTRKRKRFPSVWYQTGERFIMGLITPKIYNCMWKILERTKRQDKKERGWWCVPEQSQKEQKDKMTRHQSKTSKRVMVFTWAISKPRPSPRRILLAGTLTLSKSTWQKIMEAVDVSSGWSDQRQYKDKEVKDECEEKTSWGELATYLCMACRCFFGSENRERSQDFDSRWVKGNLKDSK